jgi:hypothetical protein
LVHGFSESNDRAANKVGFLGRTIRLGTKCSRYKFQLASQIIVVPLGVFPQRREAACEGRCVIAFNKLRLAIRNSAQQKKHMINESLRLRAPPGKNNLPAGA